MTTPPPPPPPPVLSDRMVAPLLVELRDCLTAELARTVNGPACRAMIVHSAASPLMEGCLCECEDGQGESWVRLVRLDPEDSALLPCPGGWLAVIELGLSRCMPVTEEGEALDEVGVSDTALAALSDMNALLRVVSCCPALRDYSVGLDYWMPTGPFDGCIGGALQFRVPVPIGPGPC